MAVRTVIGAIDVGYGHTKYVVRSANDEDIEGSFPSFAPIANSNSALGSGGALARLRVMAVEVNNKRYLVGQDSVLATDGRIERQRDGQQEQQCRDDRAANEPTAPELAAEDFSRRRAIAARYRAEIKLKDVQLPVVPAYGESVWHQFTMLHPRRDDLRAHLEKCGVGTEIIYPGPMHRQPCYASLGYASGSVPIAERTSATCVSLPIFPELTDEQVEHVIKSVNSF